VSQPPAQAVVRDILTEIGTVNFEPVLRAAAKAAVRQVGHTKLHEYARRIVSSFIDGAELPLDGRFARRVALPATERWLRDALEELER
jgi:hypothetical protein